MKRLFKLSGIVAVIAVMALFSMTSCKAPTQSDNTYTITFDINGATGGTAPNTQPVSADSGSITLPDESGFYRTRYNFTGWNTESDGTGTN